MFVKQIDLETAMQLAARGNEVFVLVPGVDEGEYHPGISGFY